MPSTSGGAGKRALITGITGQDGSFLAEFLLAKDYEVFGIVRRVSLEDPNRRLQRMVDERFYRPAEIHELQGNPEKANKVLGWRASTDFDKIIRLMIDADYQDLRANSSLDSDGIDSFIELTQNQ